MKFRKNPRGNNFLLESDGVDFYVSYNPNPWDGTPLQADGGGSETALVVPNDKDNKWRILNGDFRKKYEELFPNLNECIDFYEKHSDLKSSWSSK